jgi:hypothetical protein
LREFPTIAVRPKSSVIEAGIGIPAEKKADTVSYGGSDNV